MCVLSEYCNYNETLPEMLRNDLDYGINNEQIRVCTSDFLGRVYVRGKLISNRKQLLGISFPYCVRKRFI